MTSHSKFLRVFGPPGTGKTTHLINMVADLIDSGVAPGRIGYFGFTKKAAYEARDRALERLNMGPDDLPYFRTLHSFCFMHSGIKFDQLMDKENWRDMTDLTGFEFEATATNPDAENFGLALPNKETVMGLINMAKVKEIPLRQAYEEWGVTNNHPWPLVDYLSRAYEDYKSGERRYDFTDMLLLFIELADSTCPTFDTVFIDEAQDLSKLQWHVVHKIAEKTANRVIVAGDDDQAIFRWAGADVEQFLGLEGASEILATSWRVPRRVHELAESVVSRVEGRLPKKYEPQGIEGSVQYIRGIESILPEMAESDWLVLGQCNYMLEDAETLLSQAGYLFETKHGRKKGSQKLIDAVVCWKALQAGEKVTGSKARNMYSFLEVGVGVRRGFKALPNVDDEEEIGYDVLAESEGLLVAQDAPWPTVLTKAPEGQIAYIQAAERRGEELAHKPRITVSTIHGAKGGEARNVVLYTDCSFAALREADKDTAGSNDLHRTFYVGITRTKENLFLVEPESSREAYQFCH